MKLSRIVLFGTACALVLSGAVVTVAHAVGGIPTVTSVTPNTDFTEGGGTITIGGTNFTTGLIQVDFNASQVPFVPYNGGANTCPPPPTAATGCYVSVTDTQIVMETHDHAAGIAEVRVQTAGGISPLNPPLDQLTYNAPVPKPVSVSTPSGPAGSAITLSPADHNQEASAFDFATAVKFVPASGVGSTVTVTDPANTYTCPSPIPATGCFNLSADLVKLTAPTTGFTFGTLYDVEVQTAGGTSPVNPTTDQFTFVAPVFHPTGVGPPSVAVSGSTQLVFWQGAGGHLIEAWWNGNWNGPVDWTATNGWAPTVTSTPSVAIQSDGTQVIFWQGPGGHMYEVWWNGSWNGPVDWTATLGWAPTVASAPSVALTSGSPQTQVIFWKGATGHLFEVWWNGSWNGPVDWTATLGWAPTLTSAPSVAMQGNGTQVIFWQGPGSHLYEAWWNGTWNGPVDWTAAKGWGATVASTPSVTYAADGTTQLIFWKGPTGHLYEVWWSGSWNGPADWTAINGWPASMTSAPAAAITGGTQIIFWQGPGGHLDEVWWNGSWNGPADWSA